jgi:hypothetical protein
MANKQCRSLRMGTNEVRHPKLLENFDKAEPDKETFTLFSFLTVE